MLYLKLYKMSRPEVREIQKTILEHTAKRELTNGNTRSPISPSGTVVSGTGGGIIAPYSMANNVAGGVPSTVLPLHVRFAPGNNRIE